MLGHFVFKGTGVQIPKPPIQTTNQWVPDLITFLYTSLGRGTPSSTDSLHHRDKCANHAKGEYELLAIFWLSKETP